MNSRPPWFVRGDLDGFFGLFIDNLLQLMVIYYFCQQFCGFPIELTVGRVLPAAALSVLVGNIYYGWQARRLMIKTGRDDITALPYGINTPSVFAFIFLVMAPVYAQTGDPYMAWKIGLIACLISGLIESAGAFIGPWVRKYTPRAALLSAIAGIALTFISMDFVFRIFASPALAIVPMMIIIVAYGARMKLPLGIPAGLLAVVVGTAGAWILRAAGFDYYQPEQASVSTGFHIPVPVVGEIMETLNSGEAWKYMAVIVPMGLFNVVGSLQNLESAEAAGDSFPTRPSMLCNGIGTVIASVLGSCFPTTIYIGHPGWKAMGARSGYSTVNGIVTALVCMTGAILLVVKVVPLEATMGILLWIAIIMVSQAFQEVPKSHAPAVALGLIPALAGWLLLNIENALIPFGVDWTMIEDQLGESVHISGVIALSQGCLLSSMVLASMMVYVIERKFRIAGVWALVAAVLSATGLIHAYELTPFGKANSFGFMQAPEFAASYAIGAVILFGFSCMRSSKS